ncbi:uncharacterized protein LOC141901621 [Tubulanus polymorphus]|uniref:uncharacterized protein LOC141901621 n=1 Tax=Tubulanus polymorphus TaxID=672921 RepID=UPI003DA3C015
MNHSEVDCALPSYTSSDFVVLSRENSDGDDVVAGAGDCAPQEFDNIHFSLDSITSHLNLEDAIQKVRDLLQENQELKETLLKSNADINEQCQRLIEWRKQTMESSALWNKKAQVAKETIGVLRIENAELKSKIQDLEYRVSDDKEMPDLKIRITELEAANQFLKDSKQAADREISLLRAGNLETNDVASQIKAEIVDKEVTDAVDGNPGHSSDDSEIEHVSWKTEVAEMQKQIEDLRAREISQSARHTSVLKELDILRKQVETYKQMEIDFLNAQQEKEAVIRADEAQIELLNKHISEYKTNQAQYETEITNLNQAMNEEKSKFIVVLKERDEVQVKMDSILKDLKVLQDEKGKLIEQKQKLENENENLEKRYNEVNAENNLMKEEIEKQKKSVETMNEEKHVLLAMNNQLNAEAARDKIDSSLSYLLNTDDLMSHVDEFIKVKESDVKRVMSEVQKGPDPKEAAEDKAKREKVVHQLQEERERVCNLSEELKRQANVISDLKTQLASKETLMKENAEKVSFYEQSSRKLRKETKEQVENLTQQLRECKIKETQMVSVEMVQNLEKQLQTHIQQYEFVQKQLETSNKLLEIEKRRSKELDGQCNVYACEVQSEKEKVGHLTQGLTNFEQIMGVKDKQLAECKTQLEDLSRHFNQLLEDHHEMLKSCEYYKTRCDDLEIQLKKQGTDLHGRTQEQLKHAHIQILGFKEALEAKDNEIAKLHLVQRELQETKDQCVVLKQQMELYMSDFQQEREAREQARAELESAKDECERLQRQVEMCSRANIAGMQQNEEYSLANQTYGYYPGHEQWVHPGYPYPPQQHYQQPAGNQAMAQPNQRVNSDQYKCPCCGKLCPDVDTLQIHCIECLDRMENNPR